MHIGGMGEEEKLARAVGAVFSKIKKTSGGKGVALRAEINPAQTSLDPAKIESILRAKGELNKGVYKVTFGKSTKMGGHEIGNAMGVNTWAAFVGGDFTTNLLALRTSYNFTREWLTDVFLQDNTDAQLTSINTRLRYLYRPDSDVLLIYNVSTGHGLERPSNQVQLKATYYYGL